MDKALRPGRWLIYAILFGFALFTLLPLIVIVLNSFRTAVEIGRSSLIGWPAGLAWRNWSEAWGHFCIAQRCEGIRPYMENSFMMVVPATILSTALGAIAGYSISLWRFRGDTIVFAIVVMGVFLPEQMKLIPWALVLRELELTNTIGALVLIHTVQGFSFTTLFCRNYYIGIPQDLMKAAKVDGAGYLLHSRGEPGTVDADLQGLVLSPCQMRPHLRRIQREPTQIRQRCRQVGLEAAGAGVDVDGA